MCAAFACAHLKQLECTKERFWAAFLKRFIAREQKGREAPTCQGPHFPAGGFDTTCR